MPFIAKPVRVLLIDDHAVVRAGLRMLLESQPGLIVVGEAANRSEALAAARERPDIILLDLVLAEGSGLDFLPELLDVAEGARVLILTAVHDSEVHRRAIRLGAMGLVPKEEGAEILLKAIEKVHAGEVWLDRSMVASILGEMTQPGTGKPTDPRAASVAKLSAREREVVALVGEGLKNKQIAERLFISEATVRHHLTSIFGKLGVADRLELAIFAYQYGLARPSR